MQTGRRIDSITVARILCTSSPIILTLVKAVVPALTTSLPDLVYTPRSLVHSHKLLPLALAPWSASTTVTDAVSRLLQCGILYTLPASTWKYLYGFWLLLGLGRALIGFLLTRSVGWALPSLFSHRALYETSAGFGPSLMVVLMLDAGSMDTLATRLRLNVGISSTKPILLGIMSSFCWLENRPWTYGISLLGIFILRSLLWLIRPKPTKPDDHILPLIAKHPAYEAETVPPPPNPIRSDAITNRTLGIAFLIILVPYYLFVHTGTPLRLPLPPAPSFNPILDILILSFPRPTGVEHSAQLFNTTVKSFLPYLAPEQVVLSGFTHASKHPAFNLVSDFYTGIEGIAFHMDTDSHPDDIDGHYLHLSEAFRWAEAKPRGAEWFMLVEDDFPICHGTRGWEVITTVVNMLESKRSQGWNQGVPNVKSGFIGTGGSGLIIHRSYLPLLSSLLKNYSSRDFDPDAYRPAPDQVVQECLLGRETSPCQKQDVPQGESRMIISSRLVLDHIGGMATTSQGKALNSDKWRCGWRHPFHGDELVEVVVV